MGRRTMSFAVIVFSSLPLMAVAQSTKKPIEATLKASRTSLAEENRFADSLKLERFRNRTDLEKAIDSRLLVRIVDTEYHYIAAEVGEEDPDRAELYVYARPAVRIFLERIVDGQKTVGPYRIKITSLVRTEEYQRDLAGHNSAAARGRSRDTRSTHTTGSTIDFSLVGFDWNQRQYIRKKLLQWESEGAVQAIEETHNGCFHVLVNPESFGELPPEPDPVLPPASP